ncbi:MAG: TonB-dependent receptor [Pseudomonadota bacterium]
MSLALVGLAPAAHAADRDDEAVEDIIVTATKQAAPLSELALSVTVVEGDVLSTFNGAEDLTQRVAGLQAAVANGTQIAFQIRGIGAVDHQALTPTAAAVYADGVFLSTNVQTSPLLFDTARAEVLKGPQGSLYGRNASSGAINFVSVQPGDALEGYAQLTYGTFERINLLAASSVPVSEQLSLRLSGRYLSQDPTLDNVVTNADVPAPPEAGGVRDEFGLRSIARYDVSAQTRITVNLHYAEDNGINVAPRNDSLDIGKHEISIGPDGIQDTDNEFFGAFVSFTHDFGKWTLFSQTAYEGYNQQYGFDFDGTPAPFGVPSLNSNLRYDRNLDQFTEELRLSYRTPSMDFMAGVFLAAEDFDQEYLLFCGELNPTTLLGTCRYVGAPGRVGSNPASDGVASTLQSLIEQQRRTAAAFTYNTIELADRLDLVVGARLTYERIEGSGEGRHIFDDGTVALNNRDDLGPAVGSNVINDTQLTGNLGLNYRLASDTLVYASYARGYKSGGFNGEVINNATHFVDEGLFGAETVDAFELGLKFKGDAIALNVAGFYQFYDAPQARIFVPFDTGNGGSFTSNSLANLDEATSFGLEADVTWQPMEGLDMFAGLTVLDTQIDQQEDPAVPQNAENFDGNRLPFASEVSLVFNMRYEWPLTPTLSAAVQANGKYQTDFFLDAEGLEERRQEGYEVIDVSAFLYLDNGLEIGAWARNLTNQDYAVSGFGFIGYNTFRSEPRTYGVTARFRY